MTLRRHPALLPSPQEIAISDERSPIRITRAHYTDLVCAAMNDTTVGIFKFGSIKLLRIPVIRTVRPGHFCNPVKLAIEFVREDQKCVM